MFGGGLGGGFGGGYGGGQGNSRWMVMRYARLGLLLLVIIAGVAFHNARAAATIRVVGLVVILAAVGLMAVGARARRSRAFGGPMPPAGGQMGPIGPIDVRGREDFPGATSTPALTSPGWYPDPTSSIVERYWDGAVWSRTRRRIGDNWVED